MEASNTPAQSDKNYALYQNAIFWVEVDRILPNPFQPRREFDEARLKELAESIRMYGLLQPITVTKKETLLENGGIKVEYELIAGERRLRASKLAGLLQIPVIIRSGEDTDQMKLELAIIENLQREDLNAVDRAYAFQKLNKDFGFTHRQIGLKMGKSREYVANTLRLLNLPEHILTYVKEGRVNEGHTRPLLMLNDRPEEQAVLVKEILLKKISVREAENIARRSAQEKVREKHKVNPEIISLERVLTESLGTRVVIETREVGGRVVISFFSPEDLHTLVSAIEKQKKQTFSRIDEKFEEEKISPSFIQKEEKTPSLLGEKEGDNSLSQERSDEEEKEVFLLSLKGNEGEIKEEKEVFISYPFTKGGTEEYSTTSSKEEEKEEVKNDSDDNDLYALRHFTI
jgi:ParB family transcriptional regulator, chromosome partitioning protein